MTPQSCYDLVSALKDAVDLPVVLHTHCTTGLAFMTYLKGIEAWGRRYRYRHIPVLRRRLAARDRDDVHPQGNGL